MCGDDTYSGKNYDHRRGWVESLLFELEAVFAIDVAAFAVMSNHLHVVLCIDIETANRWSDREVLEQWHKLFKGDELTQKFAKGELVEAHEVNRLRHSIAIYRSRLCDISCQCFQKSALLKRADSKASESRRYLYRSFLGRSV
ncbi:transposase [Shewanella sp. HN-41]|nr:transposase [Shewanella sp. HN-41]